MKKIFLGLAITCLGFAAQSNAQIIMSQHFVGTPTPGLPAGWTNTTTAITGSPALGWQTTTSTTNLYFTTVSNAAPHTEYAVCNEWADSGNNPSMMTSPTFSLATATAPFLSYDYVYNQVYYATPYCSEQSWVEISSDAGSTWHYLDSIRYITTGTWTNHTVSLATYIGSASCKIRFIFKDNGRHLMGTAIGNIDIFNSVANDISLTAVTPIAASASDYFVTSTGATFGGTMRNMGTSTITSFTAWYQVGTGAAVSTPITCSVAPLGTYNFSCSPYTVTTLGQQPVNMWISETGDPVLSNDSMNTTVIGVSFMPTKKLLIEEATGTWCGWCVRGIVYMDSLKRLYGGNVSLVAVHNSDPMTVTAYDSWMTSELTSLHGSASYPNVVLDRQLVSDPGTLLSLYTQHHTDFGYADITMAATLSGSTITVPVTVNPALALTSGDYRLALVFTEDSVHSTVTGGTWDQHNYYNGGGSGAMNVGGSAGYNFVTLPAIVPATTMYYNHVNRYISTATGGTGLIPGTMAVGTPATHTFTAPVTPGAAPTGWVTTRLNAVVMLIDGTTGKVLNSQNAKVMPAVGVTNVTAGVENLSLYPNPASNQVSIQMELKNNTSISMEIIDMTGKVVYSSPSEELTSGMQSRTISTANFATGIYNVRIQTGTGFVTERLTIAK